MAQKIGQGGTITLDAFFKDGTGSLVDPVDPRVSIVDPDSITVVANAIPTKLAVGHYEFDYEVAEDAKLGVWTARWTGSINGVAVTDDDAFEVVAAGDVDFDGPFWITRSRVETVLQTSLSDDPYIEDLIEHAQGLAEIEVGKQTAPSAGLKSVLAQIVARMWRAGQSAQVNPAGVQSETAGPFTYQDPNARSAGLGLTDREKKALRKAAGVSGLYVQPTIRADALETPPTRDLVEDVKDPIDKLASAQQDVRQ